MLFILVGLFFSNSQFATAQTATRTVPTSRSSCFSPEKETNISRVLTPLAKYRETPETIRKIHDLIWSHRETIDPRLVYYRILGESRGQAEATNASGAYGLFQFADPGIKARLRRKLAQNPKESPRYIQIKFYYDEYMKAAIASADAGNGCSINRKVKAVITKKWSRYSNLEKAAYLGMNNCSPSGLSEERNRCQRPGQYRDIACPFAREVLIGASAPPLCPTPYTLIRSRSTPSIPRAKAGAN